MLPSFVNWLSRRKKQNTPIPGRMSDEESKRLMSSSKTQDDKDSRRLPPIYTMSPEELEAHWKDSLTADSRTGITDAQRAAANANNPKHSMSPDELEDLWNRTKSSS